MAETIVGLEKLERKLKKLERPERTIARGLSKYQRSIQGRAEKYPPESVANRPPPPYYVRGRGTFTGAGYQNTSQKMSNRWDWDVQTLGRNVRLVIRNLADYSGYVIGARQQWYHAMRGWLRVDKYVEMTSPKAVDYIAEAIDDEILNR